MSSRPRFVILAGAPVFVAAVVLLVVVTIAVAWLNGNSEKTARDAATRFAAALVHNDPNAAPPGAREYVSGVREYFGPVTGARLIGTRHSTSTASTGRPRVRSSSPSCCCAPSPDRP